jgi:hypothetical protein
MHPDGQETDLLDSQEATRLANEATENVLLFVPNLIGEQKGREREMGGSRMWRIEERRRWLKRTMAELTMIIILSQAMHGLS